MRTLYLLAALILSLAPAQAAEQVKAAGNARIEQVSAPVRDLIQQQIEAVRQDDARAAFAAVAPSLKKRFVSGRRYLKVLRAQFPALAEAKIVSFGPMRKTSYGNAQMVRINDSKGEPWLAFFLMDRTKHHWRIANVVMVKLPSVEA